MPIGDECMQRRINRAGARVQVEDAMAIHRIHRVLDLRLWATLRVIEVDQFHRANLVYIKRSEAVAFDGSQIAARPLDPQYLDARTAERVFFKQLGRSVTAAGVRHPQVFTELV